MKMDKRGLFKIYIPYGMRGPLIFTLFFALIGIAIKSISAGHLIFLDFFIGDYLEWFKSFGGFIERIETSSMEDFLFTLLKNWYYFFYTGGLISLIWELLSWLIHLEWSFSKPKFYSTSRYSDNSTPQKRYSRG